MFVPYMLTVDLLLFMFVFLQPNLPTLTETMQSAYPTPKGAGAEDILMSLHSVLSAHY